MKVDIDIIATNTFDDDIHDNQVRERLQKYDRK